MADVGSLGQYKVVVTADYSQLQTNFKAMADFVTSTTKSMTDSVNQSMSSINATMLKQLQTTVDQLKKSFEGLGEAPKKAGDGFKSYTKQINEATKEMQKAYQEQERMQRELEAIRSRGSSTTVGHLTNRGDEMAMVQAIEQQKAKVAELTANVQRLRQEEERYKNTLNQSDIAAKQRAKDMKQAAKDEQNLVKQNAKLLEGEMRSRQKLSEATKAQAEAVKQVAKEQANVVKQLSSSAGNTGYGDYARRVREEAKAEADFRKQQGQANLAAEERAIAGRTAAHKAGWEEIIKQEKIAAQEAENFRKQQGQAILAAEERAIAGRTAQHKAAWQEIVKQEDALDRQKQTEHNRNQQRIKQMQTQYNVAYAEINKYLQSHAKMSEAVFIRLQGKIQAITAEMQRLGAMPVIRNPLGNMNYADYEKQFGKFGDMMKSLKHHLTWMASAAAIGVTFGIPANIVSTIADVEKQMAAMRQVNHDVNTNQVILNQTTQEFIGIAQQYGHSVDEIIKAGTLWGRQYKDLNEVMKLTNLSAKLAVADNMDIGLANRAVESVINGYQRQGDAVNFANHVVDSWTKIAHNAQSSATDLAEALMRTGAAAKAVGVDFDTTNALASAMIKSTGRSGAEVGNALKSLFSSIHSDKAIKQLEALGIQMYKVDTEGQKHFRNLHDVFMDLMITSHTTAKNMEKDLLAISGGKFQWSKVASVLGSYKDFLHAYTMSLDSTNFSKGQLEAQLDTITRKFEQLKATMTGIATGIGASGLSAYIKNILSSLNAFAQALQRIPTSVWKLVGGFVAVAGALGTCLVVVRLITAGIKSLTIAQGIYAGIVAGTTAATEGWAAAMTAATGGLNILLGLVVAGAAAFLGYNAIVSSNIEAINSEAQALEDSVQVKRQEIEMSEKQGELIETLCNNHVKLQEALNTTKEGTEQHKKAEEDLAATDKELTAIIGDDAMQQIDWNGNLQGSIKGLQNTHSKKTRKLRMELAQSLDAQAAYQEAEQQRIEATITNLETEGTAWTALGHLIESILHSIGGAMVAMGEGIQSVGGKIKEVFPDMGGRLQDWGSSIMLSGIKHQNFHSEWSDDRVGSPAEIAAQKAKLVQSKVASSRAKAEADAIRSTGGTSNPYSNVSGGQEDSGIVTDDPNKSKKGTKGSKAPKAPKGAKEADNSPEAMGYRYLTGKGLDKNMVLGILANIAHESSFNPDATNGNHWGMIQWDSDRWGRFLGEYLSMRGMSQSDYYSSDVNTKRTLQYDYIVHEMTKGAERGSYQKILDAVPSTPEQWAHLINMHYERSGVYSGGTDWERQKSAREYATRFERKNGEDNYTDGEKAIENAYKQAKKLFDLELRKLKYEREMKGEKVTALDEKALYEKIMFVNGKNPYALLEQAQNDYQKQLLEAAKYEAKRQEDIKKATETQVSAIEKMADSEVAFAEKLGLYTKQDVRDYYEAKNERNYAAKKPLLDAQLGATVDMSKGTADEMLEAYRGLVYAQDETEAKTYANKIMWLSRDVSATAKALDEELKLELKYQEERRKIQEENFLHKNRYITTAVDSFVDSWQDGLESVIMRTKSFSEALQNIFKNLVGSIVKLFTQDMAERLRNIMYKTIFNRTYTGNNMGVFPQAGGAMQGNGNIGYNLSGWASTNLSSMKYGGGKSKNDSMFTETLINQKGVATAQKQMAQVTNTAAQGARTVANVTKQASQQALTTTTTNAVAEQTAHAQKEATETQLTVAGAQARTTASNQAQVSVMANLGAMMTQMLAAIAIMAVFSALFGGGGGSSTSTSTSSVNLGRSPDSYYMTPTPVKQSTTFVVPSMDIGGNIEKDMLIYAHKNEMVLTPEQAEVIRSTAKSGGSMGNGGANANIKSNITVSTIDSRGFDRTMRDYNRNLSKQVKKGIRNGYLNAKGLV